MRNGSPFEAYYYIGEIQASQVRAKTAPPHIKSSSCAMAVSFYKLVAERGVWDDDPSREAELSWLAGTDKDKEIAILKWWIAAERGSEVAQNNLAYVLDQGLFHAVAHTSVAHIKYRSKPAEIDPLLPLHSL